MKRKLYVSLCVTALVLFYSISCTSESNDASSTAAVPFANATIKAILDKCSGSSCHSSGGRASGEWTYNSGDYERSIKANAGLILREAGTYGKGMASSQYANLSQSEVDSLNKWYNNGAPNGTTTTTTTKIALTYASVKSIFDSKCASCHASGKSDAGRWLYDATDYASSIQANKERIHTVTATTSASMSTRAGLTATEVNTLNTWYNAGSPASE